MKATQGRRYHPTCLGALLREGWNKWAKQSEEKQQGRSCQCTSSEQTRRASAACAGASPSYMAKTPYTTKCPYSWKTRAKFVETKLLVFFNFWYIQPILLEQKDGQHLVRPCVPQTTTMLTSASAFHSQRGSQKPLHQKYRCPSWQRGAVPKCRRT